MNDQTTEQQIQAKGKTGPRVLPDHIDALVARIQFVPVVQPAGTTSTFVHAFLDGDFLLATGHSACVDPANFDEQIGIDIATKDAQAQARKKLWELEGYALRQRLLADAKLRAGLPAVHPEGLLLYTGTKTLFARQLTRGDYNAYRGWVPPEGEDQGAFGYLVEYTDGGQPNDSRHAGYISWSPADVFEKAYRRI